MCDFLQGLFIYKRLELNPAIKGTLAISIETIKVKAFSVSPYTVFICKRKRFIAVKKKHYNKFQTPKTRDRIHPCH
jgi:hypothetical protein